MVPFWQVKKKKPWVLKERWITDRFGTLALFPTLRDSTYSVIFKG